MESGDVGQSKKRKRKRSFVTQAKRHGKRGRFGRGTVIEEDVYKYFVSVLATSNAGFSADEDKEVFVANVFSQVAGKEVEYSRNQLVSKVVEDLLPDASPVVRDSFVEAFTKDIRIVVTDPFASHVLEQLIKISTQSGDFLLALKVTKFIFNNAEELVWDKYANQVCRTAVGTMAEGIPDKVLMDLTKTIIKCISWPNLDRMPYHDLTSGLLQSLMRCVKDIGNVQSTLVDYFFKHFLLEKPPKKKDADEKAVLHPVLLSVPASRLIETFIELKLGLKKIFKLFFKGNISQVAHTRNANLTLQKYISAIEDEAVFVKIFDALKNDFGSIIECGNAGVVQTLAKTCLTFPSKQGEMLKHLEIAMGCPTRNQEKEFFHRVAKSIVKGPYDSKPVTFNGSLTIQSLFHFKKPIKLVNGLLDLGGEEMKGILCDPCGCHIADAFADSKFVGEKSRERFIKALRGHLLDYSKCKFGSRIVDKLFTKASAKLKLEMGRELMKSRSNLYTSIYGRIICSNMSLELLSEDVEKWKKYQEAPKPNYKKTFQKICDGNNEKDS